MKKNLARLPLKVRIISEVIFSEIFLHSTSNFWACYIHKNIKKYEKYTFFGEFDSLCNEPPLDFFQLCCSNNEVWRLVDQLDQKVELIKPGYFRYPHQNNSRKSSFLLVNICEFVRTYIVMVIWKILWFISRAGM